MPRLEGRSDFRMHVGQLHGIACTEVALHMIQQMLNAVAASDL